MNKYFTFETYDQFDDPLLLQFEQCKLLQQIGPYYAGDEIDIIVINMEQDTIEIYEHTGNTEPPWKGQIEYIFTELP